MNGTPSPDPSGSGDCCAKPSSCPVIAAAAPLGSGLQTLGLGLMAGGMLALGAFTAPQVFGNFPREAAGPVMATIFRRFDIVLLVCLGLVWVGELLRCCGGLKPFVKNHLHKIRACLLLALTLGVFYSTLKVNADIARFNREGVHREFLSAKGRQFEKTHKLSETLYKVDLLLAVLLILLTPFAGRPRAHA